MGSRALSWNGEGKLLLADNISLCFPWASTHFSPSLRAVRSSESLLTLYFRGYKVIKMDIFLKIRQLSVKEFWYLKVKNEKARVCIN